MKKFDLIIVGGGAGAFAAAIRANDLKAKTAIINTGLPIGGTCVNVGCVPSKTLLWAGEIMHLAKSHNIPGIDIEIKNFDFKKVIQDELNLVDTLRKEKYEKVLKSLSLVTFINGRAKFISEKEVEVNGDKLFADKFIIAVGSTANVPPIENIEKAGYVTHIEALKLENQPTELVIVGAGPVGLEFAQMYARFGTKVTILEHGSSIFKPGEPELIKRLVEIFSDEGITVNTDSTVIKVSRDGAKKVLTYKIGGEIKEISCDEILLAAGKTPNTQDLGLDKSGVKINGRKAISVNEFFMTNVNHIYAVGDAVALPLRLETTAGREGTFAAENALAGAKNSIDYSAVPFTIFTDPQLAGVGITSDEQMKQKGVCVCRTVSFDKVPKAIIMNKTKGLIKMGIDPKTKQILGVHILGSGAGELIAEAMMLVKNKNTIDDVTSSLPMFPTLSEAIKIVALSFTKDISKLSCCV